MTGRQETSLQAASTWSRAQRSFTQNPHGRACLRVPGRVSGNQSTSSAPSRSSPGAGTQRRADHKACQRTHNSSSVASLCAEAQRPAPAVSRTASARGAGRTSIRPASRATCLGNLRFCFSGCFRPLARRPAHGTALATKQGRNSQGTPRNESASNGVVESLLEVRGSQFDRDFARHWALEVRARTQIVLRSRLGAQRGGVSSRSDRPDPGSGTPPTSAFSVERPAAGRFFLGCFSARASMAQRLGATQRKREAWR